MKKLPHGFLGLTWAEIASILGVLALIYGGLKSLIKTFRDSISEPFTVELSRVRHSIDELTEYSHKEHQNFDKRLDQHDIKLGVHDIEIGTLYNSVGISRKDRKHDEN